MSDILDDMDSRPGSTTSLLRTVIGIYLRELGGWISVAHLLELMDALGVPNASTRTAIARVKKKGLLVSETHGRAAGYTLSSDAVPMLARGDRRVYHPRSMGPDSRWCVVSFSIPEELRHVRHQLRRRLHWIGCGTVSPALWIAPAYLLDEVEEILIDLDAREYSTVFVTDRPRVSGELAASIARWWDLDELRSLHEDFIVAHAGDADRTDDRVPSARDAFGTYIRSIDTWRIIPYVDPGLPEDLLPSDWPGRESSALFHALRVRYSGLATDFVSGVTGTRIDNPGRAVSEASLARS